MAQNIVWPGLNETILRACITGPPEDYPRTWPQVIQKINVELAARGLPPTTITTWRRHYESYTIFKLAGEGFEVRRVVIANLPWTLLEFDQLERLIPSTMPGGRSNDPQFSLPSGKPNWPRIGAAIALAMGRPEGDNRYRVNSLQSAYKNHILSIFNQHLARIQQPVGSPSFVPSPVAGPEASAPGPSRLLPEVRDSLRRVLQDVGEAHFDFDFQYGTGWVMQSGVDEAQPENEDL